MLRKVLISVAAVGAFAVAAPAMAGNYGGSTSGWNPKPPKGSTTSTSTSGGNTTTTSGGTKVPEPGMLGMAAAGLIGLGAIQLRRRKAAKR